MIYSVPVLEEFFAWAESTVTGQENLQKAINYTLNHRKYFTNFLLDGRIPLSNNLSEIAVRPLALTRKNALFSDSVDGAIATATVFSIINTARANSLDPYKYLEYLFRELPNLDTKPEGKIDGVSYSLDFEYYLEKRIEDMEKEDEDYCDLIYEYLYENGVVQFDDLSDE